MKKIVKLSLFFFLLSTQLVSQNEAWNWYFGVKAGISFSTSPPTVLTNGAMNQTGGGCAAISDGAGNLLFYCKGDSIWNRSHQVMANGTGLAGGIALGQVALIIKQPGNANIYYVFTSDVFNNGLRYSIVDMNLAAGMGSVTVKNSLMFVPSILRLTAVRHCNGSNVWVIGVRANTNYFHAFLVSPAGVSATAVTSTIGTVNNTSSGQMKASPTGRKIGLTVKSGTNNAPHAEVFDFDNSTGIVSNSLALGPNFPGGAHGCEFSPDGSKFYCGSSIFNNGNFYQWDLCAGSDVAILASQYSVAVSTFYDMQIAPDGKIYTARSSAQSLGVINNPNAAGAACNYVDPGLSIAPRTCVSSLPNFMSSFFKTLPPTFTYTHNPLQSCLTASFTAPTIPTLNLLCSASAYSYTSMNWLFGDPGSGPANTSTLPNPSHTFSGPGIYTVKIFFNSACGADTLRQTMIIGPVLSISSPSVICASTASAAVSVQGGGPWSYVWMPGGQTSSLALGLTPGNYTVTVTDNVSQCSSSKTINLAPTQVLASVNSTVSCTNATAEINVSGGSGNYTYTWSPGNQSTQSVTGLPAGTYTVGVMDQVHQCLISKTLQVTSLSPTITVLGKLVICLGQTVTLTATGAATYSWTPGGPVPTITVSPSSNTSYAVVATNTNGCSATIVVTQTVLACAGIGEGAASDNGFNMHPNPANDVIIVGVQEAGEIKIYDQMGRMVLQAPLRKGKQEIVVSSLSVGLYIVKYENSSCTRLEKLIVQ